MGAEPSGSLLPRPQNVKSIGGGSSQKIRLESVFGIKREIGDKTKKHSISISVGEVWEKGWYGLLKKTSIELFCYFIVQEAS